MNKHKFHDEKNQLFENGLGEYYCFKCDDCVCIFCQDKNHLSYIWKNYEDDLNKDLINENIDKNRDLINEHIECKLTDDEYLIKHIIE
jgi:hypothetical protein